MHAHNFFYVKTFKIAPTCFDPKIIFRELHCSLLNMILGSKHVGTILNVLMYKIVCMCISWCANCMTTKCMVQRLKKEQVELLRHAHYYYYYYYFLYLPFLVLVLLFFFAYLYLLCWCIGS